MFYMDEKLKDYASRLLSDNLYCHLEFDEKEKIENELHKLVEEFSASLEEKLGYNCKGVKLEILDICSLKTCSDLYEIDGYRGKIICSRLVIIAMYQMFYSMNYENIVSDGKNINNIKSLLFYTAMRCIFLHELAHIYKGHLKLYNNWENEGTKASHYLDIQTLEWDADAYAATQVADTIRRLNQINFLNDKTDFVYKITIGAISGMMYWQRDVDDFSDIANKEHLPIYYRMASMLKVIGELGDSLEKVKKYFIEYEKEFNKISGITKNYIDEYSNNAAKESNYIEIVENNWEKVKIYLKPYSLFPLEDIQAFS